jgi:dihydroneopterin aldolase
VTETLTLRGLRARGNHGVLPEERREGQVFVVDAVLHLDMSQAIARDDLSQTVDYADLAHRLVAIVGGDPVDLIETLAERLAACCLANKQVQRVELTVHKPDAPIGVDFDDIAVTVVRERS